MPSRRSGAAIAVTAAILVTSNLATAQSPSASPPSPSPSIDPAASLGAMPGGWTLTVVAAPLGAPSRGFEDAAVLPDGTFVALAAPAEIGDNVIAWVLPPGATEAELAVLPKSDDAAPEALAPLGDGLVAIGSGDAWLTGDGRTWKPAKAKLKRVTPEDGAGLGADAIAVASIPGKGSSVALGVIRSADGRAWTTVPLRAGKAALYPDQIATSAEGEVVVAGESNDNTPSVWTSLDGTTYQPATLAFDPAAWNTVRGLTWGPLGPVMVAGLEDGNRFVIDVALDGTTFTRAFDAPGPIDGPSLVRLTPAVGGGLFAVGEGMILTSPDGQAWTVAEAPELAGVDVWTAAALPDGRVVLATTTDAAGPALIVAEPAS